ncbi:hypothetical protein TELCIR_02137 [Teladorsagia circumcincta]|uniref:Uncharacterized protein n=1 Tax=Teladorsagia circumcincta TaxID=45464 RepID=A0A2G9V1G2_TELCI|nr:hypothetical protein TELCIR_02137 [Teladorsagia circumcincta]
MSCGGFDVQVGPSIFPDECGTIYLSPQEGKAWQDSLQALRKSLCVCAPTWTKIVCRKSSKSALRMSSSNFRTNQSRQPSLLSPMMLMPIQIWNISGTEPWSQNCCVACRSFLGCPNRYIPFCLGGIKHDHPYSCEMGRRLLLSPYFSNVLLLAWPTSIWGTYTNGVGVELSGKYVNQVYGNETSVKPIGKELHYDELPLDYDEYEVDLMRDEYAWRSANSEEGFSRDNTVENSAGGFAERSVEDSAEGSAEGSAAEGSANDYVDESFEGGSGEPVFRWKIGDALGPLEFTPNVSGIFLDMGTTTHFRKRVHAVGQKALLTFWF